MTQPDVLAFLQSAISDGLTTSDDPPPPVRNARLEVGDEPPCVLLEEAGFLRDPSLSMYAPYRVSVTTYGRTEFEASELYRRVTDLLHRRGPEIVDGVGLWRAYDETGSQPRDDPDTRWPARFGIVGLYMPDTILST